MNKTAMPQNIEAECGVLGSLIIDPDAMPEVRDTGLSPGDFYRDAHRVLYEHMLSLTSLGTPADFITLCNDLETKGKLKVVGGADYITSLVNQVPTSGNATAYASIVVTKSRLRSYIHFAGKLAAIAYEELDVTEVQKVLEEFTYRMGMAQDGAGRLYELRELVKDYAAELGNIVTQMENHPGEATITGVPSGFPTLDAYTAGFRRGDLITVAGLTGAGKTSFLLTMAYQMARLGLSVALYSLEMPKEQLVQRFLSMHTGIPGEKLLRVTLEDDEWMLITSAIGEEMGAGIWISDLPLVDPALMRSRAQWLQVQHGIHAIFVDYLQLAQASVIPGKRIENRVQEVTEISRQLKILATDLNLPVIAAAQLSREVMHQAKKIPTLAHLRESGGIEQNSPVVIFLYREDMDEKLMPDITHAKHGIITVIVAKNRHLHPAELSLFYHGPTTRFMELDEAATRNFVHQVGDEWFARRIDTRYTPPTTHTYTPYEEDPDE
jgi:replicative DNA helicase